MPQLHSNRYHEVLAQMQQEVAAMAEQQIVDDGLPLTDEDWTEFARDVMDRVRSRFQFRNLLARGIPMDRLNADSYARAFPETARKTSRKPA